MMIQSKDEQDTRELVVRVLKIRGSATVLELAEEVSVSPVTVRHHLNGLQADGLVDVTVVRRSVGRPHHVYHLTDAGEELFPRQYLSLSKRLLDRINNSLSPEHVARLFEEMAREIADEHAYRLQGKTAAQRMEVLAEILDAEGFMVTWHQKDDEYRIIEHNCPYRNLAQDFPAVCQLDRTLIATVLEAPAEKVRCQTDGADHCAFRIRIQDIGTGAEDERQKHAARHQK
jgi:predicted ArsR family transcriptional regulator